MSPMKKKSEISEIQGSLMKGILNRATLLCLIYMAVFMAYSFTSISFIQSFDPQITLWSNTWPRLLFNVLPLAGMFLFLRSPKIAVNTKVWVWALGLPVIFLAACFIHIWRIIAEGNGDIYLYVHSANTFILVTSVVVVSPPLRIIIAQMFSFALTLVLPLGVMLYLSGNFHLLQFSVGDYLIAIPVATILGNTSYRLRYKIAIMDLRTKKQAVSFLGSHIAQAIYEHRDDLLESRKSDAVIVQMDIRGFTDFYNSNDPQIVNRFMRDYHGIVSREVGRFGGYWHKSIGDAHLLSFGAMDLGPAELADIMKPKELAPAGDIRQSLYFSRAYDALATICNAFEALKVQHGIQSSIRIGAAIAYGEVEIRIQGDEGYHRELDIDGSAIIRCARLEEYTKVIGKSVNSTDSIVVIAPELERSLWVTKFLKWEVSESSAVRNFPDIKNVYYKVITNLAANAEILKKAV